MAEACDEVAGLGAESSEGSSAGSGVGVGAGVGAGAGGEGVSLVHFEISLFLISSGNCSRKLWQLSRTLESAQSLLQSKLAIL